MIKGMSSKARVTITLSQELLSKVDRAALASDGASRSSVIEEWLRRASEQEARAVLDRAIASYYDGLSQAEREENDSWGRFSTQSFMVRESRPNTAYSKRRRKAARKRS
jgi:Ribbon-helix-helix protein, copG family